MNTALPFRDGASVLVRAYHPASFASSLANCPVIATADDTERSAFTVAVLVLV
jgi:hypothetical protein